MNGHVPYKMQNIEAQQDGTYHSNLREKDIPEKIWPVQLSIAAAIITLVALLLLPVDGWISRNVEDAHSWPAGLLYVMTNLVLATPYVLLFITAGIVSLIIRRKFHENVTGRLYNRAGLVLGQSLFALLALLCAGLIVNVVKYIVGRPRPELLDVVGPYALKPFDFSYAYVSFPSGHACTAGVLAALLALWFPRFKLVGFIVLGSIAFLRVVVHAHYPSDVLVGYSVGVLVTLALARYFVKNDLWFRFDGKNIFPKLS